MYCHVSAQIAEYAADQGRLTAEELDLEQRTEATIRELLDTPPNKMPEPIRTEVMDLIRDQAWRLDEPGRDA